MEILSYEEARIIGSLIEKEYTTPEYYPLTINSLTNACNQKSSRNPVVSYDEVLVEITIQKLRDKSLVAKVTGPDLRVPKYRQQFSQYLNLTKQQVAVLCVLLLRGSQTIGEIKSRCYRIYEFRDLAETEEILDGLINMEGGPYVIKLPKESGRENRYTHLFCGEPQIIEQIKEPDINERVALLEKEVDTLKEFCINLKAEFENFKKSFE
ncbi:MAG: YceH family protein [Melioribacteraceae bacterium]